MSISWIPNGSLSAPRQLQVHRHPGNHISMNATPTKIWEHIGETHLSHTLPTFLLMLMHGPAVNGSMNMKCGRILEAPLHTSQARIRDQLHHQLPHNGGNKVWYQPASAVLKTTHSHTHVHLSKITRHPSLIISAAFSQQKRLKL